MGGCGVQNLLNAVDVGGKGGDDDTFLTALELPHKGLSHGAFAEGVAGAFHIGGVRAQGQHPRLPQSSQPRQVNHFPVDGRGVNLEVAGMHHRAHMGMNGKGHGIRDGVIHMDELHRELSCPDGLSSVHSNQLGTPHQPVFLQFELYQPGGEARAVNGHIHLLEDVRNRPHMVLVPVGDEQAPYAGAVLDEVGHVGDNAVNAV